MEKLLHASFQELERQTIFFASPDKLNDPMEGLQDLIWDGDHIVWSNLFKNYVHCMSWSCINALAFGNEYNLKPKHIPIRERWDTEPTPQAVELFEDVWANVSEECELQSLARSIAELEYSGIKHKVRRAELLFYLQSIHRNALRAIQNVLVTRGYMTQSQQITVDTSRQTLLTKINYFELVKQVPQLDASTCEPLFSAIEELSQGMVLRHRFAPQEVWRRNGKFLVIDFPSIYVGQLHRLLWPEWYTACFVKEYHNSSMWAKYGDSHRGACLIFEADEEGEHTRLKLKRITGGSFSQGKGYQEHWNFAPMIFQAVRYQSKPAEVDFFRSMGQPSQDALLKLWYTDESGNLSDCATQVIGPEGDVDSWREAYWDNFTRDSCFKTKDWEYEQESRLILYSLLEDSLCARKRTLTYDFNSLKGIVFGIKTTDDQKVEVFDILTRKCRENLRTDFKFLQAFYSPETGDIRSYEIRVDPP